MRSHIVIAKKLFAAASLAAVVFAPAAAHAVSAYTTTTVNVRSGPDTAYPAVDLLPPNVTVEVVGCLNGWSWCDVTWGPNRGWIAGAYLQAIEGRYRQPLVRLAPRIGVPIVQFRFGEYWDSHYRARPFYNNRGRWERWDHDRRRWNDDRGRDRDRRR